MFLFFIGSPPVFVAAQLPQVADSRLGVDALKLNGGKRFYGFALAENSDRSLQFAVERAWLESTYPDVYEAQTLAEVSAAKEVREELIVRIQDWITDRQADQRLVRFLKAELAKIQAKAEESLADSQFTVLKVERDTIRDISVANAERRQIAGLAYVHSLPSIVSTPAALLRRQLEEQGIDVSQEKVDLTNALPRIQRQNARQWAARKALFEFQMREELEYQGTGTTLIKKGEGAADVGALMGKILGGGSGMDAISQLGAELGLPEFTRQRPKSDWWQKVTREAEEDGFTGVLITRLEQSMLSQKVVVETSFFAMEEPGKWFLVVEFRSSADVNSQQADRVNQLKNDPQIKGINDILSGLGLDASEQLDQALRHGAATQQAMQDADSLFSTFLGTQTRSLDDPPVDLPDERQR